MRPTWQIQIKKDFDRSYPYLKDVQAVISRKLNDLELWTFNLRLVWYEKRNLVSINLKPGLRSSSETLEIERANVWVRTALRFYIQIKPIYQVINLDLATLNPISLTESTGWSIRLCLSIDLEFRTETFGMNKAV